MRDFVLTCASERNIGCWRCCFWWWPTGRRHASTPPSRASVRPPLAFGRDRRSAETFTKEVLLFQSLFAAGTFACSVWRATQKLLRLLLKLVQRWQTISLIVVVVVESVVLQSGTRRIEEVSWRAYRAGLTCCCCPASVCC